MPMRTQTENGPAIVYGVKTHKPKGPKHGRGERHYGWTIALVVATIVFIWCLWVVSSMDGAIMPSAMIFTVR